MRTLIKFFLDNAKLTFVITFITVLFGLNGLRQILREEHPNVNMAEVRITTAYPGATADEVEIEVTRKIEEKIKEVKGLKDVKSVSQINLSIMRVRIDMDHFDVDEVIDDLREQLDKVTTLPAGATKPELREINTEEMSVIEMAIVGDNAGRARDKYAELLKEELEEAKGVLRVDEYGYAQREFSVKVRMDDLVKYHVGIDEITTAIANRSITIPAGSLKSYTEQGLVRIDAKTRTKEELENVLVRSNFEGRQVYLKDLAIVEDLMVDKETYTKINGKECTILVITKQAGTDTIKLAKELIQRTENMKKFRNSEFESIYFVNAAEDVEYKFDIIISNVIMSFLMVLFFLLIFLPGRLGIVTSLALPIIILTTLGLMPSIGINLDNISMLAIILALGLLVDDSVLVAENFAQMIEDGMTVRKAAYEAAAKYWVTIFTTSLTTMCSFMPMFLTKGVMGLFIRGIPVVVSTTILVSIAEVFFLMPSRLKLIGGSIIKQKKKRERSGKEGVDWFSAVAKWFEKIVYVVVKHQYISLGGFIFLMIFSIQMLKHNQFLLFPPENVELYQVKFETAIGDSLEKLMEASDKLTKQIQDEIGIENIDNIVAYIGQSGTGLTEDLQQNHHTGELRVYINKDASFKLDYKDVLNRLRAMDCSYLTKIEFLEEATGPAVGRAVEVNIRSNNEEDLMTVLNYVYNKLKGVKGIIDLETNDYKNDDDIFIKLDYDKVARLGLNAAMVGQAIQTSVDGTIVGSLSDRIKEFYIKVRFDDDYKKTENDLKKIKIRDRNDNLIPLSSIAKVVRVDGATMKHRYDFKKAIMIRANVDTRYITALQANAKLFEFYNEIKDQYPEVSIAALGEQESAQESFESLMIASVFAIVLMIALLVFIFNSYSKPLIILTTIPLGLVGFATAFYLHGRPISFIALIGVIGLIGIVVNPGLVLVTTIGDLRKEHRDLELDRILAMASASRVRAVLASALTTIGGLLPTAYGIGGRDASLIPVTLAMGWGLVSSTAFSLLWIPVCYKLVDQYVRFTRKLKYVVHRKLVNRSLAKQRKKLMAQRGDY